MRETVMKDGHHVQLLHRGAMFFPALIAAIDRSTVEVRLETYIFSFDTCGEQVAHALVRAAKRGVAVYVLMDAIGTDPLPAQWVAQLKAAGVRWQRFSPLGRLGLLIPGRWRRLHRKLCVVDGHTGFCGGINIQDDFFDLHHGPQDVARLDYAVQVQGPLVADMHHTMAQLWGRLQFKRELVHMRWHDVCQMWQQAQGLVPATDTPPTRTLLARLVLRDNLRNRSRIERAYRKAIGEAHQEVLIANAYFLPGRKLRSALVHAARRGVRVRLLLQGRYEYFLQYHATRQVFAPLLQAGVEIYEYRAGFLHAKVAVVDARWATVGSSNLDPLSLLLAREANVVIEDTAFAQALRHSLTQTMDSPGVRLEYSTLAARPWAQRLRDWLAYAAVRLALFLVGARY